MPRIITFREAVNEALLQEMERDQSVIAMGEDVIGGSGADGEMDAWGGHLDSPKACMENLVIELWIPQLLSRLL